MEAALRDLLDRDAIRTLIYTYCRAVDRIDVPLGHSIWHDDGIADYGASYYQGPGRGVIDLICASHAHLLSHSHQVTNILISLDDTDVDIRRAGSESYVTGTMRMERDGKTMHMEVQGRYLDRWEHRAGRWGLVHRTVVMDHTGVHEITPMPAHGPQPTHDRSDPSYAVLELKA